VIAGVQSTLFDPANIDRSLQQQAENWLERLAISLQNIVQIIFLRPAEEHLINLGLILADDNDRNVFVDQVFPAVISRIGAIDDHHPEILMADESRDFLRGVSHDRQELTFTDSNYSESLFYFMNENKDAYLSHDGGKMTFPWVLLNDLRNLSLLIIYLNYFWSQLIFLAGKTGGERRFGRSWYF